MVRRIVAIVTNSGAILAINQLDDGYIEIDEVDNDETHIVSMHIDDFDKLYQALSKLPREAK
jgi:hypothetical protein